ncbi:unnamed protein product, partial [Mesorhabditis belari]|uniref:[histone H3]-lysine(27) N-trimethyltransferase n=1 Tax=Mesorhabditis belari TaxID=2138241 RepID=A0AAF3EC71_9BILA
MTDWKNEILRHIPFTPPALCKQQNALVRPHGTFECSHHQMGYRLFNWITFLWRSYFVFVDRLGFCIPKSHRTVCTEDAYEIISPSLQVNKQIDGFEQEDEAIFHERNALAMDKKLDRRERPPEGHIELIRSAYKSINAEFEAIQRTAGLEAYAEAQRTTTHLNRFYARKKAPILGENRPSPITMTLPAIEEQPPMNMWTPIEKNVMGEETRKLACLPWISDRDEDCDAEPQLILQFKEGIHGYYESPYLNDWVLYKLATNLQPHFNNDEELHAALAYEFPDKVSAATLKNDLKNIAVRLEGAPTQEEMQMPKCHKDYVLEKGNVQPIVDSSMEKTTASIQAQMHRFNEIRWRNNMSAVHTNRRPVPCNHPGKECKVNECECLGEDGFCTKYCQCGDCPHKFPGCACKGVCSAKSCGCFFALVECDPNVCHPAQRSEGVALCCKNMQIGTGVKKNVEVCTSEIKGAGYGLFLREPVNKDELIGEYVGEVLDEDEANRRGLIYDKTGVSYLFRLNKEETVDPCILGSTMRFANHKSGREANCYVKTPLVDGVHRIGVFASQNLRPGAELFFDYRWDEDEKKQLLGSNYKKLAKEKAVSKKPKFVGKSGKLKAKSH